MACSLNYGAALRRKISQDADKMDSVARFLCNFHGRQRQDAISGFSNSGPAPLEMFIIVINIFCQDPGL